VNVENLTEIRCAAPIKASMADGRSTPGRRSMVASSTLGFV
jgi:hypothetical protein